jgi:hypothetical protein
MKDYVEPELSILVLDFLKPEATRECLQSVKRHILFPHKVIYLHNGPGEHEYPYRFYQEGLTDHFIQTNENNGLGVGTRDLVAACFSPYFMMLQNDQVIGRDFTFQEFEAIKKVLAEPANSVQSVSLAGPTAGINTYSERCHIMMTYLYKEIEPKLPNGGAGPYGHQPWREGAIQELYRKRLWIHHTDWPPLVANRGVWTVRDNPDGSRLHLRTDTKALWWEHNPKESYVFPELTEAEWTASIAGKWVNGTVPETYLKKGESFNCWGDVKDPLKDYPRDR